MIAIVKRSNYPEDVAIQAEFCVDTSLKDFTRWLTNYTSERSNHPISVGKGVGYFREAEFNGKMQGLIIRGISPWQIRLERHYSNDEIASTTLIEFEIEKLGKDRLKVEAICEQPGWAEKYFRELLAEIEKWWPEPTILHSSETLADLSQTVPQNAEPELVKNERQVLKRKDPEREKKKDLLINLHQEGETQEECAKSLDYSVGTIKKLTKEIETERNITLKWK